MDQCDGMAFTMNDNICLLYPNSPVRLVIGKMKHDNRDGCALGSLCTRLTEEAYLQGLFHKVAVDVLSKFCVLILIN